MNERDFFYWLQGAFEMNGATCLHETNANVAIQHAELVVKTVELSEAPAPLSERFFDIKRLLADFIEYKPSRPQIAVKIQATLAAQFQHVIDPSFGGPEVQAQLNAIHAGNDHNLGGTGPNGEIYRC